VSARRHDFVLLNTWLLVGVTDALFASAVSVTVPPLSNPLKVFQGVASVLIGKDAMNGGAATGVFGLMMHFSVALFWSTVFVLAVRNSATRNVHLADNVARRDSRARSSSAEYLAEVVGAVHRPHPIRCRADGAGESALGKAVLITNTLTFNRGASIS